ncbi:MAG: hypothetical protein NT013_03440, partial [Planctomycetia bacterium]|nr:hypothetical protein [Planctomycetia bacterium]
MGSSTRRRRHQHFLWCPSLEVLEDRIVMAADAVIDWNNIALDAIRVDKTAPPRASRALAILRVAIYDSVNAIERTHEFYLASPETSELFLERVLVRVTKKKSLGDLWCLRMVNKSSHTSHGGISSE